MVSRKEAHEEKCTESSSIDYSLPSGNGVQNGFLGLKHYKMYFTSKTSEMDRRGQRGLHEKDIIMPKNDNQAMRSKHAELWCKSIDIEMTSAKDKNVLREIPRSDILSEQQTIRTMWVFDMETDQLGYLVISKHDVWREVISRNLVSLLRIPPPLWHAWSH